MSSMWENAISNHPLFECCRSICRKWVIRPCIGQGWNHRNGFSQFQCACMCAFARWCLCECVCPYGAYMHVWMNVCMRPILLRLTRFIAMNNSTLEPRFKDFAPSKFFCWRPGSWRVTWMLHSPPSFPSYTSSKWHWFLPKSKAQYQLTLLFVRLFTCVAIFYLWQPLVACHPYWAKYRFNIMWNQVSVSVSVVLVSVLVVSVSVSVSVSVLAVSVSVSAVLVSVLVSVSLSVLVICIAHLKPFYSRSHPIFSTIPPQIPPNFPCQVWQSHL